MTPGQSDGNAGRAPTATLTFVVTTAAVLAFLYLIRRILLPFVLEFWHRLNPILRRYFIGIALVVVYASTAAYIAYAIALRLSIDQFFGPIVLGRAAHVRPVVVLFCFLSGGILLGVAGVIMAVPVALAIKVALSVHNDRVEAGGRRGASA